MFEFTQPPPLQRLLFVRSLPIRRSVEKSRQFSVPALNSGDEKFNCRLVLSA